MQGVPPAATPTSRPTAPARRVPPVGCRPTDQSAAPGRGLFGFVAAHGATVVAVAIFGLSETLPQERRLTLAPRAVALRCRGLLGDRVFVGVSLIGGLMVSGVFAIMTSSFLLQETYGLDAQGYSVVFALNAVSFVIGTQVSARLIRRIRPALPLLMSLPQMIVSGFAIGPASSHGVIGITLRWSVAGCCRTGSEHERNGRCDHGPPARVVVTDSDSGIARSGAPAAAWVGDQRALQTTFLSARTQ